VHLIRQVQKKFNSAKIPGVLCDSSTQKEQEKERMHFVLRGGVAAAVNKTVLISPVNRNRAADDSKATGLLVVWTPTSLVTTDHSSWAGSLWHHNWKPYSYVFHGHAEANSGVGNELSI